MESSPIVIFEQPGPGNTSRAIEAAGQRLVCGGIEHVVVASSTGETALACFGALGSQGARIVCVTHHVGFRAGDEFELDPTRAAALREAGIPIVTATHALSGVSRSISSTFGGTTPVEVVAHTLRLFGQGMKVCVEIAVMAADSGAIPTDRDVLAIGGSGRGADTVVVLRPAHMNRFFDLRIREILAKPRAW